MLDRTVLGIAAAMLCTADSIPLIDWLNPGLVNDLMFAEGLVEKAGGFITSRQTVAFAIADWCRHNPGVPPYQVKLKLVN